MSKIQIVDNPQIVVWADPDRGIIHSYMKAYCYGANFREALTGGLEAMKQYKITKWLSDNRNNRALPHEDEEWAFTVWNPAVIAAGWTHWALVQPPNVIGQLNSKRLVKNMAALGVDSRLFSDPDEAMKWLESA